MASEVRLINTDSKAVPVLSSNVSVEGVAVLSTESRLGKYHTNQ
jgi:hypothetical protein